MSREQYEYNGFIYRKLNNGKSSGTEVIHNISYPKHVFKYYSLSKYSVDALTKSYFYASHPFELNDYLDSSPFLWFASKPLAYELYNNFLGQDYSKEELFEFYKSDAVEGNFCKGYISLYMQVISNIFGIISLSANENSLLMWPHYTQEKGFQITFDAKKIENNVRRKLVEEDCYGLIPINYSEKLNPIDISEYDYMNIPFFYATNIKTNTWSYEEEWRLLIGKKMMGVPYSKIGLNTKNDFLTPKENRYVYYDKELVEQITLGINFFTAEDFNLEWLNDKQFRVSPKKSKSNYNYECHKKLLAHIYENFKDKLFHSGVKYENDETYKLVLIRTKERLDIKRDGWDKYIFTRTQEVIKMF